MILKRKNRFAAYVLTLSVLLQQGAAFGMEPVFDEVVCEEEAAACGLEAAGYESGAGPLPSSLKGLRRGVDYSTDTVVAQAKGRKEAEDIAKAYGASLESFSYGVAVLSVSGNDTCESVLSRQESSHGDLPVIYPRIYSRLCYEADPGLDPSSDMYQWMHGEGFLRTQKAWEYSKGDGVTVAVIDTGVAPVEELGDRLLKGVDATSAAEGVAGTGDTNGHGTHVASIVAAEMGNGIGGAGVAPLAKIYPVRVFYYDKDLQATVSDTASVVRGINAAIDAGADIINYSAGGTYITDLEMKTWKKAIDKGIVVVAAAGNGFTDSYAYPAAMADVISVAALDCDSTLAEYSNYGNTVDIAAPGSQIWSAAPVDSELYRSAEAAGAARDGFMCISGTSMAAPAVTGVAALLLSADPSLRTGDKKTQKTIKDMIRASARDVSYFRDYSGSGGYNSSLGAGIYGGADALAALSLLKQGKKIAKPVISVGESAEGPLVTIECSTPGSSIYYTLDGTSPTPDSGILYREPFVPDIGGEQVIKAVAFLGKKKSKAVSLKSSFIVKPVSVSLNGGSEIYVPPGGKAAVTVDFTPWYASDTLSYQVEGEGFSVDAEGVVTCTAGSSGSRAVLRATTSGGLSASVNLISKSSSTGIITCTPQITLVCAENEGTRKAGAIRKFDLGDKVKSNDQNTGYILTSSKPKICRVVNNRYLVGEAKGKAVITVTANDGSGKKAKCKVNVMMPTLSINAVKTSTGFVSTSFVSSNLVDLFYDRDTGIERNIIQVPIARGGKMKLTPYMNRDLRWLHRAAPSKKTVPSNRKVRYEISGNGAARAYVKGSVLYCMENARVGDTFYVRILAADGFGAQRTVGFRVYEHPGDIGFGEAAYGVNVGGELPEYSYTVSGKTHEGFLSGHLHMNEGACPIFDVFLDVSRINRTMTRYTGPEGNVYAYNYLFEHEGKQNVSYRTRDGSGIRFGVSFNVR